MGSNVEQPKRAFRGILFLGHVTDRTQDTFHYSRKAITLLLKATYLERHIFGVFVIHGILTERRTAARFVPRTT